MDVINTNASMVAETVIKMLTTILALRNQY